MKTSLSSLLLLLVPAVSVAENYRWTNETVANYVTFPSEVQTRLANELQLYKSNGFPLPTMRVFQSFPEQKPRIWLLLKSINARLHPILWPHVHYNLTDGLEFGCRQPVGGGSRTEYGADAITLPVTTSECHSHCLHKGRYCIAGEDVAETLDGKHRRAALKEIVRRLCMDTIYHAKDPRFIRYIEEFDKQNCLHSATGTTRACSIEAMHTVGMKWSDISSCVNEDDEDKDVPHDVLDRNMRHLQELAQKHGSDHAWPLVTINGEIPEHHLRSKLTTAGVFQDYCNAFPSYLQQPIACHICKDCQNVRACLWDLKCDGEPFDPANVRDDVLELTAHPDPNADVSEPESSPNDNEEDEEESEDSTASSMMSQFHELDTKSPTEAPVKASSSLMSQFHSIEGEDTDPPTAAPVKGSSSLMSEFHSIGDEQTDPPTPAPQKQHTAESLMGELHQIGETKEPTVSPQTLQEELQSLKEKPYVNEDPQRKPGYLNPDGTPNATLDDAASLMDKMDEIDRSSSDDEGDDSSKSNKLNNNNNNDDSEAEEGSTGHEALIFWAVILTMGPLFCGLIGAYYYSKIKHERKMKLLAEIREGKYSPQTLVAVFRDNMNPIGDRSTNSLGGRASEETDYVERGGVSNSVDYRSRAEKVLRASSVKDLPTVDRSDVLSGTDSEEGSTEDDNYDDVVDIRVDELLEDESEWVENKRVGGDNTDNAQVLPPVV